LQEAGCRVTTLHDEHNPLFGGIRPDPVGENVRELAAQVRNSDADLGLAVDGDADRFGIVDANGDYVHANHVLALVCDYVAESRGWKGEVVRTVATSHLLDSVAAYHGCTITQTPTGFKFIGGRLVEAPKSFVFGGEESNGMTVRGHTPEKDGILACLLVAEMVAAKGISLRGCLDALFTRFGERFVDRIDLELPEERKQALLSRLESDPPSELGGVPVTTMDRMDGFKLILSDGSFLAIRASGTEPLVRCYLDAASAEAMARLTSASRELVANQ
jgi:phosphomannomutase